MTTEKHLIIFKKNNTKNRDSINVNEKFIETYGNVTLEEAFYNVFLPKVNIIDARNYKIEQFEKHLLSIGVEPQQSNRSESRYYYHNGNKYRFSSHVYPTGSMTSEDCFDFAADMHLIDDIEF